MRENDIRKESQKGQDSIRRRVMHAITVDGMKPAEAARVFGGSRTSIWSWRKKYEEEGKKGLVSKKRGRRKGLKLNKVQSASIKKTIIGKNPGQLRLPGFLWTRDGIAALIEKRYGIKLSRWTVGRYLKEWGMSVQKPARRAIEQNPVQVRYWLKTKYPAIVRQAIEEGAKIFWGDEMGLRSDHQTGTTWGIKGQTPVVRRTGRRFGCNMLSAISSYGHMSFMVFDGRFSSSVFIEFLDRLVKHYSDSKVFLIVDRHSVHRSKAVLEWVDAKTDRLRLFYLPPYSPELNPDELLNHAAKDKMSRQDRAQDKEGMKKNLRSFLRSTQRQPAKIRNFFNGKHIQYGKVV